jgi:hypothetical protein
MVVRESSESSHEAVRRRECFVQGSIIAEEVTRSSLRTCTGVCVCVQCVCPRVGVGGRVSRRGVSRVSRVVMRNSEWKNDNRQSTMMFLRKSFDHCVLLGLFCSTSHFWAPFPCALIH